MTNEEARLILINYLYNLKKLDKKVFTAMILALAALSETVYCKDCKHLTYEDWGTGKNNNVLQPFRRRYWVSRNDRK